MVAFPRVRLRLTRGYREVRPPWGRRWMGAPFRGFASLTRGYRSSAAPVGPMSARHAADPRKFAASRACRVIMAEWSAAKRACRVIMAGWSAAKRSNYSVTEGELSEPSDGCGMGVWAPRGANARVWCTGVMRQYGDGRSVSLAVVRPLWGRRWKGLPFRGFACGSPAVIEKFDRFAAVRLSEVSWCGGAVAHRACGGSVACGDGICSVVRPLWGRRWMGVPFRGFASLTRGYREVRPLRGRPPL